MHIYEDESLMDKINKTVSSQLRNIFVFDASIEKYLRATMTSTEVCFVANANKYFRGGYCGEIGFSLSNTTQYSIFLWILSNEIYKQDGSCELAERIYSLNKMFSSVDWYYELNLPKVFGAEHPLGSVLGRAQYGENLFLYQGTTVGGVQREGNTFYPKIGNFVTLYANSKIIGDCQIGDYVTLGSNCCIINQNIPNSCVVFGSSPNLTIIKKSTEDMRERYYLDKWIYNKENSKDEIL